LSSEHKITRRVAGWHDIRMDGMQDLVVRARGASVLDIVCNRGLVGFEMANNGAERVYGCDNYVLGITTARELFADLRSVKSRFEMVQLDQGPDAFAAAFGADAELKHDIVLLLATLHKLKRVMSSEATAALIRYFGDRCGSYFGWRATSDKPGENEEEMALLDVNLKQSGLFRIHTSYISTQLGVCAIWGRRT
jgi:hypothetical protein